MVGWVRNAIHALVCELEMYVVFAKSGPLVYYQSKSEAEITLKLLKSKGYETWIKIKTEGKYDDIN